jgi:hypothetical protein
MKVRGKINWLGKTVLYDGVCLDLTKLIGMIRSVIEEMCIDMVALLFVGEGSREEGFPEIHIDDIQDKYSEEGVGYSFHTDSRNNR